MIDPTKYDPELDCISGTSAIETALSFTTKYNNQVKLLAPLFDSLTHLCKTQFKGRHISPDFDDARISFHIFMHKDDSFETFNSISDHMEEYLKNIFKGDITDGLTDMKYSPGKHYEISTPQDIKKHYPICSLILYLPNTGTNFCRVERFEHESTVKSITYKTICQ